MDYRRRLAGAQEMMRAQDIDWLIVTPSSDLAYLTGIEIAHPTRLTALLLPVQGEATIVIPQLEAAALDPSALPGHLVAWPDGTDPLEIVRDHLEGARAIAAGEHLTARHLLPLQSFLPDARLTLATPILSPLRMVKDDEELALLLRAAQAADRVFERILSAGLEGRTEREVAAVLSALLVEEGHDSADFAIVASGPYGAEPHHESGERRIERGDLVVLDFGGLIDGYRSDITRTVAVGDPAPEKRAAYEAVRAAQDAGVRAVAPGVTAESVDMVTRDVLRAAGYGEYFIHRTGHGLGLDPHEPPYIVAGDQTILQPGMVFSVEPGVYLPGRFGIRVEDIVAVTPEGAERLNSADHTLRVLD